MNRKILYLFTLLTFIFCALFLYSCTKDCAHQYGEWTVKTEATCAVEGKETRTCSLCNETEEKTIPATGEHNISDGVCTVCQKTETEIENENNGGSGNGGSGNGGSGNGGSGSTETTGLFYYDMFSSVINGDFTIALKDLGYIQGNDRFVINVEDLYISAHDLSNISGYGNAKIVELEDGYSSTYDATVFIEDGKCYAKSQNTDSPEILYSIGNLDDAFYIPFMSVTPAGALTSILPEIIETLKALAYENKESVNEFIELVIEGLFSKTEETNELLFTLDFEKIKEFSNTLYTITISEIIDAVLGEGGYESLKESVYSAFDMTFLELIEFLEENDIGIEAFLEILSMFMMGGGEAGGTMPAPEVSPASEEESSILEELFGVETVEELKKLEIVQITTLANLIFGISPEEPKEEIENAKNSLFDTIDAFAEQTVYEVIAYFMGADASFAEEVKESVDSAIEDIAEVLSISFTTGNNGELLGASIKLDEFTIGEFEIAGEIAVTKGALNREKYESIKEEIIAFNSVELDFGKVTNAEKIYENGKLVAIVLTDVDEEYMGSKEFDDTIHEFYYLVTTKRTYFIDSLYTVTSGYQDCKNWRVYILTDFEVAVEFTSYEVKKIFDLNHNLISETKNENGKETMTETSFTILFNTETKEIEICENYEAPSKHNYEVNEEMSKEAEGCTVSGEIYSVCTECAQVSIELYTNGHSYESKTEMLGKSCEDGIEYSYYCSDCGEVFHTFTRYEHNKEYFEIDLSALGVCVHHYVDGYVCPCEQIIEVYYDWSEEPCEECGFFVSEDSTEIVSGCYYETHSVYVIKVGATVVKTFSGISSSGYEHEYKETAELLPGSETCYDGVELFSVCALCADVYSYTVYYHHEVLSETIKLQNFGATGIIEIYRCACGLGSREYYELVNFEDYSYDFDYNENEESFVIYYTHTNGFVIMICEGYDTEGDYAEIHIGYDKESGSCDYTYVLYTFKNTDKNTAIQPR